MMGEKGRARRVGWASRRGCGEGREGAAAAMKLSRPGAGLCAPSLSGASKPPMPASWLTSQVLQAGKAGRELQATQVEAGEAGVAQRRWVGGHARPCRAQQRQAAQRGQRGGPNAAQDGGQVVRRAQLERQALQAGVGRRGLPGRGRVERRNGRMTVACHPTRWRASKAASSRIHRST